MDTIASGSNVGSSLSDEEKLKSYALMHKALLKSMNAYAIVLSILLASSFTGFSQAPKPWIGDPDHISNWQHTFTYFNGLSFFSSVTGLLFYASSSCSPLLALHASAPPQTPERKVEKQIHILANFVPKFFNLVFFFGVSLTCCVFAYVFAGLSAFPHKRGDWIPVILTTVIGGFVYIQALCICCADAYRLVSVNMRQDAKLWVAMKKDSLFGRLFGCYMDHLCSYLNKVSDADAQQGPDLSTSPLNSNNP